MRVLMACYNRASNIGAEALLLSDTEDACAAGLEGGTIWAA
jgi:hypothetical protein